MSTDESLNRGQHAYDIWDEAQLRSVTHETTDMTRTHTTSFDTEFGDEPAKVSVTIEYRPRRYLLTDDALQSLRAWLKKDSEIESAEDVVLATYWTLTYGMFSGYSSRDSPWKQAPMVVDVDYELSGQSVGGYVSLGAIR